MNDQLKNYIQLSRYKADSLQLLFNPRVADNGKIYKDDRWPLAELLKNSNTQFQFLSSLGTLRAAVNAVNIFRTKSNNQLVEHGSMSEAWRTFYLAFLVDEIFIQGKSLASAFVNKGKSIRILATCFPEKSIESLTGVDIQLAYNVALRLGKSGKSAANLEMTLRVLIDAYRLSDYGPLTPFCIPYSDEKSLSLENNVKQLKMDRRSAYKPRSFKYNSLKATRSPEKLPFAPALWELVRIIFTDEVRPKTICDAIWFESLKIAILTGMRAIEHVLLPLKTIQYLEHFTAKGKDPATHGGISRSMRLWHFAAKQKTVSSNQISVLVDAYQSVPSDWEQIILGAVDRIKELTEPLRSTLQRQCEYPEKILPQYDRSELVLAIDLHPVVTGDIWGLATDIPSNLRKEYAATLSSAIRSKIRAKRSEKVAAVTDLGELNRLIHPIRKFWSTKRDEGFLRVYRADGSEIEKRERVKWNEVFLSIAEVEDWIRSYSTTKISDTSPSYRDNGARIEAYEWLHLLPKRAIIEERNGGILDLENYFAIGRPSYFDFERTVLDASPHCGGVNLFRKYGETERERAYQINPHSFRHLKTTEMFAYGVADTVISKHFNRSSETQSYAYDHRTLAQELEDIDLPDEADDVLHERAKTILKMIEGDLVTGPLVARFKRIQAELGDKEAYEFLSAEAEGVYATPYGFCTTSMSIDPCPKHLQCFLGCKHLIKSPLDDHQSNIDQLRTQTAEVLERIRASKSKFPGKENQLQHAERMLEAIDQFVSTIPGKRVFPNGKDLSSS